MNDPLCPIWEAGGGRKGGVGEVKENHSTNAHVIIPDVPLRSEPVGLEEEGKGREGRRKEGWEGERAGGKARKRGSVNTLQEN